MAGRQSSLVCRVCQARQATTRNRGPWTISKRNLETVALRPEDDGVVFPSTSLPGRRDGKDTDDESSPVLGLEASLRQWKLHSPVDELREAALDFEALWKRRDLRLEVLRNLSNPWPEAPTGKQPYVHKGPPHWLPESRAAIIPHATFRQNIRQALGQRAIRQVLRAQLLRCQWPKEILRIMAVAMQNNRAVAENLAVLEEPIMRALYRCRENVSDPEVLKTLNIIISRFKSEGLPVQPQLLLMALKFAARARSLPAMKKYLKAIRSAGMGISSNAFRAVIAKFSIGRRGLGEIRNGRWMRKDLLEVLTGFEDEKHLPEEQKNHLGTLLVREDWQFLHGWVAALARCKDSDTIWKEWELWKQSGARTVPKVLVFPNGVRSLSRWKGEMTSKKRGDYWFLEQMALAGDYERAWKILLETGISITVLKTSIKDLLLDHAEHATVWDAGVRNEMLKKYDRSLSKIETALGVMWIAGKGDGEGSHERVEDMDAVMARLGAEHWKLEAEEDYGFPYDTESMVPLGERALHDAAESAPANVDKTKSI